MNTIVISILVLGLFFMSGFSKIFSFDSTVKGFMGSTGLSSQIAKIAIVIAIFIEIVAPLIVWSEKYHNMNVYSEYALISLIVFTILATIIYHKKDIPGTLKNISVIGGLLLLL